jgi:hypothetical protein
MRKSANLRNNKSGLEKLFQCKSARENSTDSKSIHKIG